MSELNAQLVPLKLHLAEAKAALTTRQWATLRAILIIALTADELNEELVA